MFKVACSTPVYQLFVVAVHSVDVRLLCSLPSISLKFLQVSMNFYEFIVNLERMLTKDCKALPKHCLSAIIPTFELAYILVSNNSPQTGCI